MHYYEINIKDADKDLLIESSLIKESNLNKSPLIILSLEPIEKNVQEKTWVCNQIGHETCFVPSKYLKKNEKMYVGVFCKDCEYELKYNYADESSLKLGQTALFHLKAGDSKIFNLKVKEEGKYININSFNLRQSKYSMIVRSDSHEYEVKENWKGGQQAIIDPKKMELKIIITANENGVFNLEAISDKTEIDLSHSKIRIDSAFSETPMCYLFENKNNKVIVHIKSIEGELKVYTQENKKPEFDDFMSKFEVREEEDKKIPIETKASKFYVCVESPNSSFYTINVFSHENESNVKEYNQLLLSNIFILDLLKSQEMYNIPNLHGLNNLSISHRLLYDDLDTRKAETVGDDQPDKIHLTGNGLAGIFVGFIVLFPVLMMIGFMNSIFVNTNLIEKSLLMGKEDN